eukprot:476902-Rhodomonas_salina.5
MPLEAFGGTHAADDPARNAVRHCQVHVQSLSVAVNSATSLQCLARYAKRGTDKTHGGARSKLQCSPPSWLKGVDKYTVANERYLPTSTVTRIAVSLRVVRYEYYAPCSTVAACGALCDRMCGTASETASCAELVLACVLHGTDACLERPESSGRMRQRSQPAWCHTLSPMPLRGFLLELECHGPAL